jgi:8-oxo-dGTP pyrophosphatase MutT (NUDIX family)
MLRPIDIIDKHNRPTGEKSDPNDANLRGLWHRGAHVILFTPSGRILIQKRSHTAFRHPDKIDIGAGGFVDSGETPQRTAIREVFEETGILLSADDLIFLGTSKYNHRWRAGSIFKTSRSIVYTFAARLPEEDYKLAPQEDEVAWVGFIPLKSAWWLIRRHYIKSLGWLLPTYAYYRKALKQTAKFIRD